jgi:hypothetical protein
VTNGQYTLEVHWSDATGDTVITRSIVVLGSGNSPAGGKVYAYPQILGPGQTSTQFKINSDQTLTLMATVYDIAGERIEAPVTGLPGTNVVNWSASRLASGIYIAVVEMTDSNGLFVDRQVTKIIVRH